MIVRNEAPVIRRCLASVRSLIDHWIVVDTGSTDGTQDLVRAALGDLPGTLIERPWVDFGHNRSEALALARPHGTYTLVIDADDELLVPPGYTLPTLDADSYDVAIADGPITYRRTQVVRNALTWVYRGVLHEFPNCPEATRAGALGLTLRRHPLALLRPRMARLRLLSAEQLDRLPDGCLVRACGLVTLRQRPQTAQGTIFVSLEDETGNVNVIVWKDLADAQREPLLKARLLAVQGLWQRDVDTGGQVRHLLARGFRDLTPWLGRLAGNRRSRDFH